MQSTQVREDNQMQIFPLRAYISDDIGTLARIYQQSATELGSPYYSAEQIEIWAGYPQNNSDEFEELLGQGHTLVATDDKNKPVAFGQLHPENHLTLLYVLPEFSRKGIGKQICATLEAIARSKGQKSLSVTASKVSKGLFEQLGFELIEEEISLRNNVAFERYNMVKQL